LALLMDSRSPRPFVRSINALCALALAAALLVIWAPVVKVLDLARADLRIEGTWIDAHARQISVVTPGGPAARAGLRVGDVLEFDPNRHEDWILAGYRPMPEGFRAQMPVRRADGSRAIATFEPDRVEYLPTLNDRLALLARLAALVLMTLAGAFLVWARPGLMTWSLVAGFVSGFPVRVYADYFLAFAAGPAFSPLSAVPPVTLSLTVAYATFASRFAPSTSTEWPRWKVASGIAIFLGWLAYLTSSMHIVPFGRPVIAPGPYQAWVAVTLLSLLFAAAAFVRSYRLSGDQMRARLRWALTGMCVALANFALYLVFYAFPFAVSSSLSGSMLTPGNWILAVASGVVFPVSFGYAALREQVVDVQFAMSRTLVFGVVSTLVLVFLAAVHWLLGRLIEHSGIAFGLEGLAAIGLGIVLHRAAHAINLLVDRLLFRRHHESEERMRRVVAALPFATEERSIAEALVAEPIRNLDLASAALFQRDAAGAALSRVQAHGWTDQHAARLAADALLVRYLEAEHDPLRLDDPQLLPSDIPLGAARPVLAVPIVHQHVLTAVMLYGAHVNHTLPDPDEVELLHALAKASATSYQQVRIATLSREVAALRREISEEKARNDQLETALQSLADARGGAAGPGKSV